MLSIAGPDWLLSRRARSPARPEIPSPRRELKQRRELVAAFSRDLIDPGCRVAKGIEISIVQAHGQLAGDVADLASDDLRRAVRQSKLLALAPIIKVAVLIFPQSRDWHGNDPMRIEQIARGAPAPPSAEA